MRTCHIFDCTNPVEGRTNKCASHNHEERKAEKDNLKAIKRREKALAIGLAKSRHKAIRKVSLTNTSLCSNGERVTNAEIKKRLAAAYRLKRMNQQTIWCEGLEGKPASGFAHIIAQARCKQLGKTELIWNLDNFFPASFEANQAIENPKGQEWKKLRNVDKCLAFIKEHDQELYQKFENNIH